MKACPVCGSTKYSEVRHPSGILLRAKCRKCKYEQDISYCRNDERD